MKRLLILLCLFALLFHSSAALAQDSGDDEAMETKNMIYDQISSPVRPDLSLIPAGSDLISNGHLTNTYFRLQDFYAKMLWNWLDAKVNFKACEASLTDHALRFRPTAEPLTVFRSKYAFGDGFFCIRNILCIERLDEEELAALRKLENLGDAGTGECMALVDDTLRKMCTVYSDMNEDLSVMHESGGESAPNFSVLLGLEIEIDPDAEDLGLEKQKMKTITELAAAFENAFTESAGVPVTIFVYD